MKVFDLLTHAGSGAVDVPTASPSPNQSPARADYTGSPPGVPGSRRAGLPLDG